MKVHEYQARALMQNAGIRVPPSEVVDRADQVPAAYAKVNAKRVVVKAQVHAGGRGKAGYVVLVDSAKDAEKNAARMFAAPSLVISAWKDGRLVGVSRALTDFSYCCYLSDLAVDKALQGKGIGRELVERTRAAIGDEVSLILLSAAGAMSYYPEIGFEKAENAFVIRRKR